MPTLEEIRRMMSEEPKAPEPREPDPFLPPEAQSAPAPAVPVFGVPPALTPEALAQQAIWKSCRYVVTEHTPAGEPIDLRLNFGKNKGKTLSDLVGEGREGRSYLMWIVNNSSRDVAAWKEGRNAIRRHLGIGGLEP